VPRLAKIPAARAEAAKLGMHGEINRDQLICVIERENESRMANVQRCAAAFTGIDRDMHGSNSCMPSIAVTCSEDYPVCSDHAPEIITYQANLCMLVQGGTDIR
jgi:hypothetical protein